MKIIYTGTDNLDFTIKGVVNTEFLKVLEIAKKDAQTEHKDCLFKYKNINGVVLPNGAGGGYQYIVSTETFAMTIKDRASEDYPVRVSIRSVLLAHKGFAGAKNIVLNAIKDIMTYTYIVPSRIDICLDFQNKNYTIEPDLFLTNGRGKRSTIGDLDNFSCWGGKKIETITIGKLPNRQIQIYNKSKQVNARAKADFWRYIWNDNPNYDKGASDVWRLELRWGREYLRRNDIHSFDDLEEKIQGIINDTMNRVFTVSSFDELKTVEQRKKAKPSSWWTGFKEEFKSYAVNMVSEEKLDVDIPERIAGQLERSFTRTKRLLQTNITSILALQGKELNINEIENILDDVIENMTDKDKNSEFYEKNHSEKIQEYGNRFWGLVYEDKPLSSTE